MSDNLSEKKLTSKTIFEGRIFSIYYDTVELPDGNVAGRELLRHRGAVCIIPVTDDGKVIIEKQFRYPVDQIITEIPAGKLDFKAEPRLDAAKRELKEETGYTAEQWTDLGSFYPAPAYSDEYITMFLAQGLKKGSQILDKDEFLDVAEVPLTDLVKEVMLGHIPDAKTQIAILKAAIYLGKY